MDTTKVVAVVVGAGALAAVWMYNVWKSEVPKAPTEDKQLQETKSTGGPTDLLAKTTESNELLATLVNTEDVPLSPRAAALQRAEEELSRSTIQLIEGQDLSVSTLEFLTEVGPADSEQAQMLLDLRGTK
jgi:hypothetical protein